MDSHIMRHDIISSCQSAATSEIVKHFWSRVWLMYKQRYSKYPTFTFTFTFTFISNNLNAESAGLPQCWEKNNIPV